VEPAYLAHRHTRLIRLAQISNFCSAVNRQCSRLLSLTSLPLQAARRRSKSLISPLAICSEVDEATHHQQTFVRGS
jgi:hypothetical protein